MVAFREAVPSLGVLQLLILLSFTQAGVKSRMKLNRNCFLALTWLLHPPDGDEAKPSPNDDNLAFLHHASSEDHLYEREDDQEQRNHGQIHLAILSTMYGCARHR